MSDLSNFKDPLKQKIKEACAHHLVQDVLGDHVFLELV